MRDNLLFRVSLGKLSEQGYYMTFGSDQKGKAFINKRAKGRGYCNDGSGIPRGFYAPFVSKNYDFFQEFSKIETMNVLDTREGDHTPEEIREAHDSFSVDKL
ncbi:hypothetical protein ACYSNO_04510 [Enterococcus sp. LJL98]